MPSRPGRPEGPPLAAMLERPEVKLPEIPEPVRLPAPVIGPAPLSPPAPPR